MSRPLLLAGFAALGLSACAAATATNDITYVGRGNNPDGVVGEVIVESRYGNGQAVRGPVRRNGKDRLEVRLPGGTWVECVRSCSETLRRQTVDFWENYGGSGNINGGEDGPGYLRFPRRN